MPRIFVAIPLPPDVASALARAIPSSPALRAVAPELLHVTLVFVGALPEGRVGEVTAAAAAAGGTPFTVTLGPLGRFPPSGSPTVVWAGLGTAAADIEQLGARLRKELARRNVPFDRKPLQPHVTLARVRERAGPAEVAAVASALGGTAISSGLSFQADAIHVMESALGRGGPRYTTRSELPLRDIRRV